MIPPTSTTNDNNPRGRQVASKPLVIASTASTRAKQAHVERKKLNTNVEDKQRTRTVTKPPVPKASERPNTRSVPLTTEDQEVIPVETPLETEKVPESIKPVTDLENGQDAPGPDQGLSESSTNTKISEPPPPPQDVNDGEKLDKPGPASASTSDPLQVASQLYPWLYMTSTLDACFQSAEQTAKKDLTERAEQLGEAESEFADQKARFQAEKAVELYDELSEDNFAQTAPKIMQAFLAHGNESERIEAEALQLALHPPKLASEGEDEDEDEDEDWDAPLRVYAKMLDTLETLHAEALNLETSITALTSSLEPQLEINSSEEDRSNTPSNTADEEVTKLEISDEKEQKDESARGQILGVFRACLPVLRARIANLAMAQELVDGARENMSISLRMESLGLLDE